MNYSLVGLLSTTEAQDIAAVSTTTKVISTFTATEAQDTAAFATLGSQGYVTDTDGNYVKDIDDNFITDIDL
jgi:hypothetical protein